MILDESQRRMLQENGSSERLVVVDGCFEVGMDNHGVMVCVCVFKERDKDQLYGFRWGYNSEEHYFDYEEVFEVASKQKTITVFTHADGSEFSDD